MSFLDRIFVGKVIKDSRPLTDKEFAMGMQKLSILLVERSGEVKLVFKTLAWAFFAASVPYVEVPADAIPRLEQWITEAQGLLASGAGR